MLGMTSVKASKQTLLNKITDMQPDGTTNQAHRRVLGVADPASTGPFPAPAKDSNYIYQDVAHPADRRPEHARIAGTATGFYGCSHEPSMTRARHCCAPTRGRQGIKIFAIQVATDGDAVSTVTKNCTSEPNNPNYFSYITQASQMTVKFDAIFKELAKLRVAA